jgi:membrane dipeptidase
MPEADLLDQARAIHGHYPVVECHTDIAVDIRRRRAAGEADSLGGDYLGRLREGGVRIQVHTVGGDVPGGYDVGGSTESCARAMIDDALAEAAETPGLRIVQTASDLDEVVAAAEVGLLLHFEGLRPILEPDGVRGAVPTLQAFHELGLRSLQLTWNGPNDLADGVGVAAPRRLAGPAAPVLREIERLGIVLDVAHLAEPAFWDLMGMAQGPVVCSHGNARALCDHVRNLTDDQIGAIASTGGYVGVCFVGDFIAESDPTLDDLLDHVDHIATLVGVDALAVGPDYVEFAPDIMLPDGDDAHVGPEGLRRVETLPVFTAGLLSRGYSEEDVARIVGGNALRVLRQVLPAA